MPIFTDSLFENKGKSCGNAVANASWLEVALNAVTMLSKERVESGIDDRSDTDVCFYCAAEIMNLGPEGIDLQRNIEHQTDIRDLGTSQIFQHRNKIQ